MSQITENDIRAAIATDAEKAFRMIIDLYGRRLYWHIRRIVITHDDADDALQNTFLNAWKNIGLFRFESSLLTWLWSIATNEALNLVRKRSRVDNVSLDDVEGILAGSATSCKSRRPPSARPRQSRFGARASRIVRCVPIARKNITR